MFLELAIVTIVLRGRSVPKELDSCRESHGLSIGWDPQGSILYFGKLPINFRFKPQGKFDKQRFLESITDSAYNVQPSTTNHNLRNINQILVWRIL